MRKYFENGSAFITTAMIFLLASIVAQKPGIHLSLGVVFLILGLAAKKKYSRNHSAKTTQAQSDVISDPKAVETKTKS